MASVQTSSYDGRYLKLTVVEESYSIANNTSTIRWTLQSIGGSVSYYTIYNWGVWVNGQQIYAKQTTNWDSYKFPAKTGSTTGTITINHNTDGTASPVSFELKGKVYYSGTNSYTGSINLTTIPRQANITSAPNFNDEENPTINYSNPAGSAVSSLQACISLTGSTDDISYRDISTSGSSYTFSLTTAERNVLRNACTSATSRNVIFYVKTVIGGNTYYSTLTKTLSIVNANPTFSSSNISYQDTNSSVVAITNNNQHIVRNKSNLQVTFTSATALKGASISSYLITLNGSSQTKTTASTIDYGTQNISSNTNITIKVTDSRGNTTTVSKTITFLDWLNPTSVISINRQNNYENTTYLKTQTSISSVNDKNAIQSIQYRYKKTSDSDYGSYTSISDNTQYTLTFDKLYAWNIQIVITDKFGSTTYNIVLSKGNPILFIDTALLSVGVNGFPTHSNSLEVFGDFYINGTKQN